MHVDGEESPGGVLHSEYSPTPGEDNRRKATGWIRAAMVQFRDFATCIQL